MPIRGVIMSLLSYHRRVEATSLLIRNACVEIRLQDRTNCNWRTFLGLKQDHSQNIRHAFLRVPNNPMIHQLNNLIDALREELKQYGEMLALLDQEQDLVMQRQTVGIPPCVAAINAQADVLQAAREEREQRRRQLARTLRLSEESGIGDLISRLPSEYRPLLKALVQENKELLLRVQDRASQNHLLLSRMAELMHKLISSILPGTQQAGVSVSPTEFVGAGTPAANQNLA